MSFGTEFEFRCLRFEQTYATTNHRNITFTKLYDAANQRIGMRMQSRTREEHEVARPMIDVYLDGTILVYNEFQVMQYSVKQDILAKIEEVANQVKRDEEAGIDVYRRRAMYANDAAIDTSGDFSDYMAQKFGGPKNVEAPQAQARTRRYR